MAKRAQLDRDLIGLSGEFAVASYLCLKGYVANLTLKNYPKVDIFALNPLNNRPTAIQVKTTLGSKEYFVPKNISEGDPPFVFVYLDTRNSSPQFFVVPAKLVAEISKREMDLYHETHPNVKPNQPSMISLSGISEFKNHWENLGLD